MSRKKRGILIAVTAAAVIAVLYLLWLQGAFLPSFITWKNKTGTEDLTGSGEKETIVLENRELKVLSPEGNELFESDSAWKVSDFLTGDIDNDGFPELLMLVWRKGNYGTSRPFWEDEKSGEDYYSQHIFIYKYEDDRMKPVWMSSDTGIDIKDWELDDKGMLRILEADGNRSTWFWDSWGLTKKM